MSQDYEIDVTPEGEVCTSDLEAVIDAERAQAYAEGYKAGLERLRPALARLANPNNWDWRYDTLVVLAEDGRAMLPGAFAQSVLDAEENP